MTRSRDSAALAPLTSLPLNRFRSGVRSSASTPIDDSLSRCRSTHILLVPASDGIILSETFWSSSLTGMLLRHHQTFPAYGKKAANININIVATQRRLTGLRLAHRSLSRFNHIFERNKR